MAKKTNKNKRSSKVTVSKLTFHKLNWLEWIAIVLGCWFFFFHSPYVPLFTILLVLPVVGLVLNGLNGRPSIASLVEITRDKDGEDKYDLADFINFPAMMIFARVLIDFEFESFYSLIIPGLIASILMLALLFSTHRLISNNSKSKTWIYTSLVFNLVLYSCSATYGINCIYDSSKPQVYDARVIKKYISRGRRHTSYYLVVTPWGHHYDPEKISIAPGRYANINVGETVKIDLMKGLFHIPWYYVE